MTDATGYEAHPAWAARQGGGAVRDGNRLLYPSGARCDQTDSVREEPPGDPKTLARRRRDYYRLKFARTEADLDALRAALRGVGYPFKWPEDRYGPAPAPAGDGKAAERFLAALAASERDQLAALEREFAAAPWPAGQLP